MSTDSQSSSPGSLQDFFNAVRAEFPQASEPRRGSLAGDKRPADQSTLIGEAEKIAEAISLLPNSADLNYDDYIRVGAAIKAACQDDELTGLEIFQTWCAKWEGGENDPARVEADWNRIKAPYGIGAQWIYDHARPHGFVPPAIDINKFFDVLDAEGKPSPAPEIKWVAPELEWQGKEPPKQKWLIENAIPAEEVALLTGTGGVGKTMLAQMLATCCAAGIDFLGYKVPRPLRVMGFFAEDSEDVLHRRQHDLMKGMFLDYGQISGQLRIASRKFMDNLLAVWQRDKGVLQRTRLYETLRRDVLAFGPELLIIDTAADTFGGSEIDRQQVRQFIQGQLGALARDCSCAVLLLAHPSRAGEQSGEGTSGSTAWHASVRARFYLEHAAKTRSGPLRWLTNMKANYAASGDKLLLQLRNGVFYVASADRNTAGAGDRESEGTGGSASADRTPSIGDALEQAVLVAVDRSAADKRTLALGRTSPNYAPKVMKQRSGDILGAYDLPAIDEALNKLIGRGQVIVAFHGYTPQHNKITGLKCAEGIFGGDRESAGSGDEESTEDADIFA